MACETEDDLSRMMGRMGMPDVRIGSRVIRAQLPESLPELAGHGDTIRVGDLVRVRWFDGDQSGTCDDVERVQMIVPPDDCPQVQLFPIHDPECVHGYPLARYVRPPGAPKCRLEFQLVTQAQVDAWWERRRLGPGWHRIDAPRDSPRVLIDEDGMPAMVDRVEDDRRMEDVRRRVEVATGYDVVLSARYDDRAKLLREVRHATRRPAPRVPREP